MNVEDWDRYWRFEDFRRSCDPLDFRRWKRDSQRALRALHPGDEVRLLDATAGMGDVRKMNLIDRLCQDSLDDVPGGQCHPLIGCQLEGIRVIFGSSQRGCRIVFNGWSRRGVRAHAPHLGRPARRQRHPVSLI